MKKAMCLLALAGLLASTSSAQETAKETRNAAAGESSTKATTSPSGGKAGVSAFNKASSFVGATVMNQKGEQVGKVQDLVFDLEKGELGYVVLSLESSGTKRSVPVPIRALKVAEGEKHLVLNMSESILAAAESVGEGEWPAADIFAVGGPAESETGSGTSGDATNTNKE